MTGIFFVATSVLFLSVVLTRVPWLAAPILVAVGVRVAYFCLTLAGVAPTFTGKDSVWYVTAASDLSGQSWREIAATVAASGSQAYIGALAAVSKMTGAVEGTAVLLSFWCSIGVVILAGLFGREMAGWRCGRLAATAAGVLPAGVMNAVVPLRETPFTFFLCLGVYLILGHRAKGRFIFGLLGICSLIAASALHTGGLAALMVALIALLVPTKHSSGRNRLTLSKRLIVVSSAIALVAVVLATGVGLDKFVHVGVSTRIEALVIPELTGGAGSAIVTLTPAAAIAAPLRVVESTALFAFGPPVWQVRGLWDLLAAANGLVMGSLVLWLVRHRRGWRPIAGFSYLLTTTASLAVAFALGTTTYGTAVRHRAKFDLLLVLVVFVAALHRTSTARSHDEDSPSGRNSRSEASHGFVVSDHRSVTDR